MKIVLQKLDQFVHIKFGTIVEDQDKFNKQTDEKIDAIEVKYVRKLFEQKK